MAYPTSDAFLKSRLDAAIAAHQRGDVDGAVAVYRSILAERPGHGATQGLLGTALLQLGQAEEAQSCLEQATRGTRNDPRLLANLAQAYLARGRHDAAADTFRKAARLAPGEAGIHVGLATALALAGRLDEAGTLLERLTVRFPDAPLVWLNFGNVLRDRTQPEAALAAYRRAAALEPRMAEARNAAGSVLHSMERFAEAEREYRAALDADPQFLTARRNLASLMLDERRSPEAEGFLRAIVRDAPGLADAHLALGTALGQQHRLIEAAACYARAAELAPRDARAAQTCGGALVEIGDTAEGLRRLAYACALEPQSIPPKRVSTGALLALGQLGDGWIPHAARAGASELRQQHRAWDPEWEPPPALAGARVCVIGEQGLGDALFFMRYAPSLARVAKAVTYRVDPRLTTLLARAVGFEGLAPDAANARAADVYVLAGDLPAALGFAAHSALVRVTLSHAVLRDAPRCTRIFWPEPPPPIAIPPVPERVRELRSRLAACGPAPYLGITWRAGTAPGEQSGASWALYKSVGLTALAGALRDVPGTVISLQRRPAPGETDTLARDLGRPLHDFSGVNDDLEDMLALLAVLDEYVGVSNTNMHLRAAAGKTARVLVPAPAEWRWMRWGAASPWFSGFSIYRQSLQGDWTHALAALARDLTHG